MKKLFCFFIALLFSMGAITNDVKAQDGAFSDAQTLAHKQFSLGIQPVIYTEIPNDDLMLVFRGAYGVQPGLTLHGKLGVLRDETYFGGHLEYLLASEPSSAVSFSILGGAYAFDDIGLKLGGILSKRIDPFSIYTGLLFEPLFTEPDELTPLLLPIGVDIPLAGNSANFVFEADLALNDDADFYQALHFGLNFYF